MKTAGLFGLLVWAILVTAATDFIVLGFRRSELRALRSLGRLAAGVVWALLVFAGGVIAVRYTERMPSALAGLLGFAALSFLLSLGRAALYRRVWQQRPDLAGILRQEALSVQYVVYILLATAVYFGLTLIAERSVQIWQLLPLFLGALLPDLDTYSSPLGRLFPSVSRRLEARFGHRQECHSLGAGALVALASLPLAAFVGLEPWALLSLGFLTHLLLDLLSPRGCMLLWPATRRRLTISGRRFDVSRPPLRAGVAIALASIVALLLFAVDIGPSPPQSPATPPSFDQSLRQYQSIRGRSLALADVTGTWQATGRPLTGRFEILSAVGPSFVMLDRYSGRVFTAGEGAADDLYLNRLNVVPGAPIRVKPVEVHIEAGDLQEALPILYAMQSEPGLQHIYVSGDVVLPPGDSEKAAMRPDLSQTNLRRIQEVGPGHYVLRFVTPSQLIDAAGLRVGIAELVIVGTYYATPDPAEPTVTPLPPRGGGG